MKQQKVFLIKSLRTLRSKTRGTIFVQTAYGHGGFDVMDANGWHDMSQKGGREFLRDNEFCEVEIKKERANDE